jgi:hypothetical protein
MTSDNDDTDYAEVLDALITEGTPVAMLDGSLIVSMFLLQQFRDLQVQMHSSGDVSPNILFGGMLLALINVVMDQGSWPAVQRAAKEMELPMHSRDGVRSRIISLLDALGLADDTHKFN